jgi:hypothetical protein
MTARTRLALPSDDDRALIAELFVDPQRRYAQADAIRLTRTSEAQLRLLMEEHALERFHQRSWNRLLWEEVALLALDRWTPRMINAVVGDFLPPLNQTVVIPAELPVYQLRALHRRAVSSTRAGTPPRNASDMIEEVLHQYLVPEYLEDASAQLPGFHAAAEFPLFGQGPRPLHPLCRYCGGAVRVDKAACASCSALHEPAGR